MVSATENSRRAPPSQSQNIRHRPSSSWALLSGTLGAAASCFAKLAFMAPPEQATTTSIAATSCPAVSEWMTCFVGSSSSSSSDAPSPTTCTSILQWLSCHHHLILSLLVPRIACLFAMVACNAAMVACFVGGLEDAGSIAGTALATAANFLVSAVLGYVSWDERTFSSSSSSLPGIIMVVVGTTLLVLAQRPSSSSASSSTRTTEERQSRAKKVK